MLTTSYQAIWALLRRIDFELKRNEDLVLKQEALDDLNSAYTPDLSVMDKTRIQQLTDLHQRMYNALHNLLRTLYIVQYMDKE